MQHGVEAFDEGIWVKQLVNLSTNLLIIVGFVFIRKIIEKNPDMLKTVNPKLIDHHAGNTG